MKPSYKNTNHAKIHPYPTCRESRDCEQSRKRVVEEEEEDLVTI